MAHNIDMTNNRANMAFLGSRADIWHGLGQEMQPGMSIEQWAIAAGLNWSAKLVQAFANLAGDEWNHIPASQRFMPADGRRFSCRSDNGHVLGYVSDGYQPVQPREVLDWFDRYIAVDSRFALDCAGSLKRGEIIWATASYHEPFDVAGDSHKARLLMTTTFDGSGATINKGTMVRVVCNNTLDAALADGGKAIVRTRHNTRFDAARVGRELGRIAQSFSQYKAMGEAMASVEMTADQVSTFFKQILDIPFDAKWSDLSGKKQNQFDALRQAHKVTAQEVASKSVAKSAWAALNAVTRYVDHDRSTRGGDTEQEARVLSAQFGSGSNLKSKAIDLLAPTFKDRVPVLA